MKAVHGIVKISVLFSVVFCCYYFSSIVKAEETEKKGLRAAGCNTEYYLIHDLSRGFKSSKNIDLEANRTGNMVGLKLLAAGEIDFAFTCKPHAPLVKKFNISTQDSQFWETVALAKDPIVVLVHRNNPVVNLQMNQLQKIFTGAITNWKEVGGEDLLIKVSRYNDEVGSGVLTVFKEIVLGMNPDGSLPELLGSAKLFPGPTNVGAYIAQNPGGISFMGFNSYRRRYGSMLNINGFAPNRENIINGTYPLVAHYNIIYDKRDREKAELKTFFEYIRSDEGIQIANQSFLSNISMP